MDEPLSNLDAKLRVSMRSEIVRIHKEVGATTIYVTHDQIEAMTMANRIVVMKDGFIQQIGEPNEIYRYPANMFVAGFIGTPAMNFLHGEIQKKYFIADTLEGEKQVKIKLTEDQLKLLKDYDGKRIVYGIRPENLVYSESSKFEGLKDYSFEIQSKMIEKLGDIINVHGSVGENKFIIKMNSKYDVFEGDTVKLAISPEHARFFDEETTLAILPQSKSEEK